MILCVRQNIAIGGHTDSKSNFLAILRHVFKHDEILQSHLDYSVPNSRIKYISPDIQKDIIGISGEMVRETIGRTSNDSEDFVLIGDEATDVSTHEQVFVCERFVEYTGGKLKSLFVRNFLVLWGQAKLPVHILLSCFDILRLREVT